MIEFDKINDRDCVFVQLEPIKRTEFVDYQDILDTMERREVNHLYDHIGPVECIRIYRQDYDDVQTRYASYSEVKQNKNVRAYLEDHNPELFI